jgi:hypothetical protein
MVPRCLSTILRQTASPMPVQFQEIGNEGRHSGRRVLDAVEVVATVGGETPPDRFVPDIEDRAQLRSA